MKPVLSQNVKKPQAYTAALNIHIGEPGGQAPQDVQQTIAIIDQRLKATGWEYSLKPETDKTFTISIDKVADTNCIDELLTGSGRLALLEVYTMQVLSNAFIEADAALSREFKIKPVDSLLQRASFSPHNPLLSVMRPSVPYQNAGMVSSFPSHLGIVNKADSGLLRRLLESPAALPHWPADIRFMFGQDDYINNASQTPYLLVYAIKNQPSRLTNKDITEAKASISPHVSGYEVGFRFNAEGAVEWEQMTTRNQGKPIAFCLVDKVVSAPIVNEPIHGGNSVISFPHGTGIEYCQVISILLTSKELSLPVRVNHAGFSPARNLLSPALSYVLVLALSFAVALGIQLLIFRLNKI